MDQSTIRLANPGLNFFFYLSPWKRNFFFFQLSHPDKFELKYVLQLLFDPKPFVYSPMIEIETSISPNIGLASSCLGPLGPGKLPVGRIAQAR